MAPNLDTLPMETLLRIAEMSTWGVFPSSGKAHPATYARNHASLARTCRWLYEALNGELYKRNLKKDPVTESCLLWAVNVGSLGTVKRAVAYGASLNLQIEVQEETTYCPPWGTLPIDPRPRPSRRPPKYPWSFSLLHLAVGRQHVNIVQYLLEKSVDIHAPSRNFCCKDRWYGGAPIFPLHLCLFHDHHYGIEFFWQPFEGVSWPLNNNSAFDIIELLVSNGAFLVAEGVSAIHDLSSQGRSNLVNRLLSHYDPVSIGENFRFAVSQNDILLMNDLIQRGADVAAADWEGNTALHLAAKSCKGDLSIINLLLRQSQVNPVAENEKGQTAFHLACANGNPEAVHLMLQQPGVSATHTDRIGQTSLHYACQSNHPDILHIAKLLIDMEVPIDQRSRQCTKPLYLALKHHNFGIASTLVARGCDPRGWINSSDYYDSGHVFENLAEMTPSSQTDLVQRTVDVGIDVNTKCWIPSMDLWTTALFVAACTLNADCMKVLLQGGAVFTTIFVGRQEEGHYIGYTAFLAELFYRLFGNPHHRPIVTKNLREAEEVIVVALKFGAELNRGFREYFISALEYGVLAAEDGDTALLELLLKHSTAKHMECGFLRELIEDSDNDSVREMLLDFKTREFTRYRY